MSDTVVIQPTGGVTEHDVALAEVHAESAVEMTQIEAEARVEIAEVEAEAAATVEMLIADLREHFGERFEEIARRFESLEAMIAALAVPVVVAAEAAIDAAEAAGDAAEVAEEAEEHADDAVTERELPSGEGEGAVGGDDARATEGGNGEDAGGEGRETIRPEPRRKRRWLE